MEKGLYNSILQRSEELKTWIPTNVLLEADDGTEIDMMDYITDGKAPRQSYALLKYDNDWSDPTNGKHRAAVVKYINRACMQSGFTIIVKEWNPNRSDGGTLRLRCSQNRPFKREEGEEDVDIVKENSRNTKTSKPTRAEDACPFICNVHWFKDFGRWGLKAHSGKRHHCGHVHLKAHEIKCTTAKFLKKSVKDLIGQANTARQTPAAIQTLVYQNTGEIVSTNQIETMRQEQEAPGYDVGPSSSASRFIDWLKSDPKKSYIILNDKEDTNMVRVRRPGWIEEERNQARLHCTVRRPEQTDEEHIDCTIPTSDGAEERPDTYIERVRRALKIPNSQKVLLAVAWCTEDERRIVACNPEVLGADVTEQTNNEKRSLLVFGGLTGDNRTFTCCRAFLPSQQRWVFDWFFSTALPYLFPPSILHRNTLMVTDGDAISVPIMVQIERTVVVRPPYIGTRSARNKMLCQIWTMLIEFHPSLVPRLVSKRFIDYCRYGFEHF